MKEAFNYIIKLLGSLLLIVLALALFVIVTPLALVWKVVVTIKHEKRKARDILTSFSKYFTEIAASYDQLGNAAFGGFWNWLFVKDSKMGYLFGDKDETISEVLGWNQHLKNLSEVGKIMVVILDKIERQHCEKAMQNAILKAEKKIEASEALV